MQVLARASENGPISKFSIATPAALHEHFRVDGLLATTAPIVATRFGIALAMPNLDPPITTVERMRAYGKEIKKASRRRDFRVLTTLFLTPNLDPREAEKACDDPNFAGEKFMPFGVTTKSEFGIKDISVLWTPGTLPFQNLEVLARRKKVFLMHAADGFTRSAVKIGRRLYGPGEELDPYDQEAHFVAESLPRIRDAHPNLKCSFEHMSSISGVEYMREHADDPNIGCSLTAQHLLQDRRDTHRGGLRPHRFWWPAPQSFEHTAELRKFAAEKDTKKRRNRWAGLDSAPHARRAKESACCSGGVFMAHAGIEFYAEAFEAFGALDERFEDFMCSNGPQFYGIEPAKGTVTLVRETWRPQLMCFPAGDGSNEPFVPFRMDEDVHWKLAA